MSNQTALGRVLGAILLALLFSAGALAQTGAISGKVIGPDGNGLKDALVKIERQDIKGNYKVKTNKKGEYFHAGLPLGNYKVFLDVGGKIVDQVSGVRTRLGDPVEVNFDLLAQRKKQEALQAAAQSGTLTQEQTRGLSKEQRDELQRQMKERQQQLSKNKELNDAFNAGMTALQAKQYDQAVEAFDKASTLDPKQHVVWANLAESHMGLGATKTGADQEAAYGKGLEAYAKAIETKPDDAAYHNNYALALAKAKKFQEAEGMLTKAAELDPTKAGTYFYNLGAVYTNIGQLEPAGAAFKKAIEADPKHAQAQYQFGVYLMSKATVSPEGKVVPPEGAREAFQSYLDLEPAGPFADSAKGMLQTMEATVQTEYKNPEAQKKGTSGKKTTKK